MISLLKTNIGRVTMKLNLTTLFRLPETVQAAIGLIF